MGEYMLPIRDVDLYRDVERNQLLLGYLTAALWTSDHTDRAALDDITPDDMARAESDCARFASENAADLATVTDDTTHGLYQAGVDLWLTRNGHGAGFWDGDYPEPQATRLTDAARRMGEVDLDLGDVAC